MIVKENVRLPAQMGMVQNANTMVVKQVKLIWRKPMKKATPFQEIILVHLFGAKVGYDLLTQVSLVMDSA